MAKTFCDITKPFCHVTKPFCDMEKYPHAAGRVKILNKPIQRRQKTRQKCSGTGIFKGSARALACGFLRPRWKHRAGGGPPQGVRRGHRTRQPGAAVLPVAGRRDDDSPAFQCRVKSAKVSSPGGTTDVLGRPGGTWNLMATHPALKRRAIFSCPVGTNAAANCSLGWTKVAK